MIRQTIKSKFLQSYFIIWIIPFIISIILYLFSTDILENNAKDDYYKLLEHNMMMVDARLEEINSIGKQIAITPDIISLFNVLKPPSKDGSRYYDYYIASNRIKFYQITNNLIIDSFIIFKDRDTVVSSKGVYNLQVFKKINKHISDYLDDEVATYRINRIRNVIDDNATTETLIFSQSMPIGSTSKILGSLFILIDKAKLSSYLSTVGYDDNVMTYVLDQNGDKIVELKGSNCTLNREDISTYDLDSGQTLHLNNNHYVVTKIISPYNKWTYISLVPEQTVYIAIKNYSLLTIILLGLLLIFGPSWSIYLANRHTKPINEMISIVSHIKNESVEQNNEYLVLHNSLLTLVQNNEDLQNRLVKQKPIMQLNFFRNLLEGKFYSLTSIKSYMDYIQLEFSYPFYIVIVINVVGYEELLNEQTLTEYNMAKVVIHNELNNIMDTDYYVYDASEKEMVLILNYDDIQDIDSINMLEKSLEKLYRLVLDKYYINLKFGIGNSVTELLDIHKSYIQAKKALDYTHYHNNNICIFFNKIPNGDKEFYYPLELEIELVNALKAGNVDMLKNILRNIFNENFVNRELSLDKSKQFVYLIKGTIIREMDESYLSPETEELIDRMNNSESVDEIFNCVIRLHTLISEKISNEKQSKREEFKEKVIEYIKNHYQHSTITLFDVSNYFHYSEAYMYQFFKDELGMTYSTYLEQLRLDKACELLLTSNMSMLSISKTIGYNNDTTFRRAFKRVKGVPPSSYKNAVKNQNSC